MNTIQSTNESEYINTVLINSEIINHIKHYEISG